MGFILNATNHKKQSNEKKKKKKKKQLNTYNMAAESLRLATSSLCNLSGSQRRPALLSPVRFMGVRPQPSHSHSSTSSSLSHFFGSSRISVNSSKLSHLRQKGPRNLSVFAMSADGISFSFSFFPFTIRCAFPVF